MAACTWHSPIQTSTWRPVLAEEHVGQEEHFGTRRQRLDDLDRIGGRAADIGLRLDGGRGVDVRHHKAAGVLLAPGTHVFGRHGVGQRAPGPQVGQQDGALGGEQLGRLGHEMDAAEHDHVGVAAGREAGQGEGVADVVGHVLDPRQLVIVGQQHGVALLSQEAHLCRPLFERGPRGYTLDEHIPTIAQVGPTAGN
jgi:hypothetical protein